MTPDVLERFEDKVIPEPNNGCWLWTGCVGGKLHYGYLGVGNSRKVAHKLSYEHYVGEVPEGYFVCHKCDIPTCVNPNHLFLGTVQDNNQDCYDKQRYARGEKHGQAKLSNQQAREIYTKMHSGHRGKDVAAEYGVSEQLVSHIKTGQRRVDLREEMRNGE